MRQEFEQPIEGFIQETKVDYVGFWQITKRINLLFPSRTKAEFRALVFEFVAEMFARGFIAVDLSAGGGYEAWPDQNATHMRDRIDREWSAIDYNQNPNPGEVAWFNIPGMRSAR